MTTETRLWGSVGRGRVVTKLPRSGALLIQSPAPPEIPVDRCVDVRPGQFATFDGDRIRMRLSVDCAGERRCFDREELPAVEAAVAAFLREDGTNAVRFGDRAACRRILPAAAVDAIERRLDAAARRERGTLVTWAEETPRDVDHRGYDVVID